MRPATAGGTVLPAINVFARDLGWLFEDLKRWFAAAAVDGWEIRASNQPLRDAQAWVALRTREAADSPDLSRTVVCLHDLLGEARDYQAGGSRAAVGQAGGLALCHPDQHVRLARAGLCFEGTAVVERPLGALSCFTRRDDLPPVFTVGWVGRDHPRKRLSWFLEAIGDGRAFGGRVRVVLLGAELEAARDAFVHRGVDCRHYPRAAHGITDYPAIYHQLDCLVITSSTEAGPLCLFEALASGLPVVSTPVGWSPLLSKAQVRYVRLAPDPAAIRSELLDIRQEREGLFGERATIAGLVERWNLEDWVLAVLHMAAGLTRGRLF